MRRGCKGIKSGCRRTRIGRRGAQTESQENRARIREIIGTLTEMQADIARLDAAS